MTGKVWSGGHLHIMGNRVELGPAFYWQPGDVVELPDGRACEVLGYDKKFPVDTKYVRGQLEDADGIRRVDNFLTDGIMVGRIEE